MFILRSPRPGLLALQTGFHLETGKMLGTDPIAAAIRIGRRNQNQDPQWQHERILLFVI